MLFRSLGDVQHGGGVRQLAQRQEPVARRLGVAQAPRLRPRQARVFALVHEPALAGQQEDAAAPLVLEVDRPLAYPLQERPDGLGRWQL